MGTWCCFAFSAAIRALLAYTLRHLARFTTRAAQKLLGETCLLKVSQLRDEMVRYLSQMSSLSFSSCSFSSPSLGLSLSLCIFQLMYLLHRESVDLSVAIYVSASFSPAAIYFFVSLPSLPIVSFSHMYGVSVCSALCINSFSPSVGADFRQPQWA